MSDASPRHLDLPADPGLRGRRLALWIAVFVTVSCGAAWGLFPLADARARLDQVPRVGAGFTGRDLTLTPTELQVLGRVDLIHRQYQIEGQEFYATLIDGTKDRHAVHDPRYCFQGAGWQVLGERRLPVPGGEVNWVQARHGERNVQALFWFSDGMTRYTSMPRYWWQTTLRRMTLGRSGPEPVLVVLQTFGDPQPDWPTLAPEVIARLHL